MDLMHLVTYVLRHARPHRFDEPKKDAEHTLKPAAHDLAVPPPLIMRAQEFLNYYRLSSLIMNTTGIALEEFSREEFSSWVRRLLLISKEVFNESCVCYVPNHIEEKVRLHICAVTYRFPRSKRTRKNHNHPPTRLYGQPFI